MLKFVSFDKMWEMYTGGEVCDRGYLRSSVRIMKSGKIRYAGMWLGWGERNVYRIFVDYFGNQPAGVQEVRAECLCRSWRNFFMSTGAGSRPCSV